MDDRKLRLRALADGWFPVLLGLLAVTALAGTAATVLAHTDAGTVERQEVAGSLAVEGEFDHAASVTEENPLYPVGTELSGRSTYFVRASPVLDGSFVARPAADGARNVTVELAARVVLESVRDDTVYWSDATSLAGTRSAGADRPASVEFAVNASRLTERVQEVEGQLGTSPGEPRATVVVDGRMRGTVDGERRTLRFTGRLPVSLDGSTYTVGDAAAVEERDEVTRTVTVQREYGLLWQVGGPLLVLLGAVGAGGLVALRLDGDLALTDSERERLTVRRQRAAFDDWIVRMDLPEAAFQKPRAEAASLEDLVDYGIDANAGVVEDDGVFYVVGGEFLYVYEPPAEADGDSAGDGEGWSWADGLAADDDESGVEDGTADGDGRLDGDGRPDADGDGVASGTARSPEDGDGSAGSG